MGTRLLAGIVGGLAGGILFGVMMQMMGALSMVADLVGAEGMAVGWAVHLVISAGIGAGYGLTFGALRPGTGVSAGYGLVYGAVWWLLGPLLLMPLMLGMGAFPPIESDTILSLVGHLVYGLTLGLAFVVVRDRASDEAAVTSR